MGTRTKAFGGRGLGGHEPQPTVSPWELEESYKATPPFQKSDVTLLTRGPGTPQTRRVTKTMPPAHRPGPSAELAERYRAQGWWSGESLTDRFRGLVESAPQRPALIDDRGTTLTRQQLWDEAAQFAADLTQAGVQKGDVVLVCLPNMAAWQVSFLGSLQMGAVPATLPTTTDATTLAHVCELIGARAVVAMGGSRSPKSADRAHAVAVASGRAVSVVRIADDGSREIEQVAGSSAGSVVPEGIDHLMFTSSTTGMPKAVMHTSDTLASVNRAFAERFALSEDTPIFMPSRTPRLKSTS